MPTLWCNMTGLGVLHLHAACVQQLGTCLPLQMVAQAYPFVVRKVLRNQSDASSALLRDILYGE
jgi:hypothetical protein